MGKDFVTMVSNIGGDVQDTSTAFATIIKRYINRRYFQILNVTSWTNIVPGYTFNTVSGAQNYILPDDFNKEISCTDTTNGEELSKIDLDYLYSTYTDDLSTSGTIARYAIYEDFVQTQPTSSSTLSVVSASGDDTLTRIVQVRGISGGVETYEEITLDGTSPISSANAYTRIKGISKNMETAGKITITSNSGAVTVAVIPKEALQCRYKLIKLHYVPAQVVTISLPYTSKPMPLSQDYDYPVIDCADLIELGALADCWRYKRQFSKAQSMDMLFAQDLALLLWNKENQPNQVIQFKPKTYNKDNLY